MCRLLLIFCLFSLNVIQGYGDEQSDSLKCIIRNEEAVCVKTCPPERTCRNRGIKFNCFDDGSKCVDKCVCKAGYNRNVLGDCISDEECDRCSGNHEFYSCGSACDNVCADLHKQNRTNCPIVNIKCNEKCYCEDGFARDHKNECVPIENCPQPPLHPEAESTCGPNEEWATCKKTCPPETCLSLVAKFKCFSNELCKPRCTCKPGFLRLEGGAPCMPQCQCPQLVNSPDCKCGPNEFYSCVQTCPPDTCMSLVAKFRCIEQPCKLQCRCIPGYLRLKQGTPCIPYRQCPQIASNL